MLSVENRRFWPFMIALRLLLTRLRPSFIATTSLHVPLFPAFSPLWMRKQSRHCVHSFFLISLSEPPLFPAPAEYGIVSTSGMWSLMSTEPDKRVAHVLLLIC